MHSRILLRHFLILNRWDTAPFRNIKLLGLLRKSYTFRFLIVGKTTRKTTFCGFNLCTKKNILNKKRKSQLSSILTFCFRKKIIKYYFNCKRSAWNLLFMNVPFCISILHQLHVCYLCIIVYCFRGGIIVNLNFLIILLLQLVTIIYVYTEYVLILYTWYSFINACLSVWN